MACEMNKQYLGDTKINTDGSDGFTIDVQVFSSYGIGRWAQERYLVHGIDDVLWTSSKEDVINYIKEELTRLDEIAPSNKEYLNIEDKAIAKTFGIKNELESLRKLSD